MLSERNVLFRRNKANSPYLCVESDTMRVKSPRPHGHEEKLPTRIEPSSSSTYKSSIGSRNSTENSRAEAADYVKSDAW